MVTFQSKKPGPRRCQHDGSSITPQPMDDINEPRTALTTSAKGSSQMDADGGGGDSGSPERKGPKQVRKRTGCFTCRRRKVRLCVLSCGLSRAGGQFADFADWVPVHQIDQIALEQKACDEQRPICSSWSVLHSSGVCCSNSWYMWLTTGLKHLQ